MIRLVFVCDRCKVKVFWTEEEGRRLPASGNAKRYMRNKGWQIGKKEQFCGSCRTIKKNWER